jgi:GH24 family phage-related lysozyme (muramidase)
MVDYAIANQIRPFQLPDIAGIAGAMQGLELNRMRSQQLQGAEQERNALRQLMATPGFDPSSPDAARRLLEVAPTTGAATFQALMAGQREQRQAQTAATEALIKNIELGRSLLAPIGALPETEQQPAYAAWRQGMLQRVPGLTLPQTFSRDGYMTLLSKADEIIATARPDYVVTQVPGSPPFLTDRRTGMTRPATEAEAASAPAAPAAAPRAEGPAMTPGQTAAADFLRRREGFRESPYYDVNAFRAGYGSDTATLADGTVVPVRQGMTVSREDAERDLARRIPQFEQRVVAAVGQEQYAALPPNAQAALISIAYNYGTLPGSIRAAARSGDPTALAQAVAGLAGDNQGVNAGRRREEAAMIAGGAAPNAMVAPGATTNAMLAPPDAMAVSPLPELPTFGGAPGSLAEADRRKRILDIAGELEKERLKAAQRREDAPAAAAQAGMTTGAQTTARLEAEEAVKRRQDAERLDEAVRELRNIVRPGGLLQRSTGSGAGRLLDIAGEAVGISSRGAQAAAELSPIADMVLKMVPRFEGPQSDADRKAYEAAAGRLADPTIPNETRLAAARQIIRLMENRRGQFTSSPIAPPRGGATPTSATTPAVPPPPAGMSQSDWGRLWGVMKPEERALWQN